ncbi:MAG: hypothetical protein KC415_10640 [Anaerolineales bacterium]|nr:hypothetical protein [Anaerolineales bacterium]
MLGIQPRVIKLMLAIGFALITISCQPSFSQENNDMVVTPMVTISTTVLKPTTIMEITPTALPSPTPSPTSTPTQEFVPTIAAPTSPTPTNTVLPLPTLSPNEAVNQVMVLLADNQNPECLLPCWWGATPGITSWNEIEPFLSTFTSIDQSTSVGVSLEAPLPEAVAISGFDYNQVYIWNEDGKIISITVDSINITGYDAKTMMTIYGMPDEVWIRTISSPREGVLPFQLIIVYQQKGFSLHYYVDASIQDGVVTACFEPGFIETERPDLFPAGPRMYLWEAGVVKSIEDIVREPLATFFLLQDKTDLSPETLYLKFTNPNEQPCIDTPAEDWRDIG